jgi:hypothetical protein
MSSPDPDRLVAGYLARLERALADLPRGRRRELVEDVSAHIVQARLELPVQDEAAIRNLLEGLGDPDEIAADARERLGEPRREHRGLDIAALVLLLAGGVVVPLVGWLVGVVLLWVSTTWNTRDKLIGTLVVPGGLLPAMTLLVYGGGYSESCGGEIDPATGAVLNEVCTGGRSTVAQVLTISLFVLLLVAPLGTTAYLARRMSRRSAAALA